MTSAGRSGTVKSAAVAGFVLVAVLVAVLLADAWGRELLAGLGAATVALLTVHTLRAEQQHRRIVARVGRLEKSVRDVDRRVRATRPDLKPIETSVRRSLQRLERMDEGFKDPKKFGLLREVNKISRRTFEQVQATINLFEMVDVEAAVPPMRGWAVSPDALALLVQEMLAVRPTLVVECGSGTSTLWLALAARQRGVDTRIVAIDHEEEYAEKTRRLLALHGVDDIAEVRLAPLVDVEAAGRVQPWYDPAALEGLHDIGLLFVDGPPAVVGPLARIPAVRMMWERFAPTVSIVVDDTIRPDEVESVEAWTAEHPELHREGYDTEKGTIILRRGPGQPAPSSR